MAEKDLRRIGIKVYEDICRTLAEEELSYDRNDEKLIVSCDVRKDGYPITVHFIVFPEKEIVQIMSLVPFRIAEDKRIEMALAIVDINNGFVIGSFDYDLSDGSIMFRMSNCYDDCELSSTVYKAMLYTTVGTVSKYSDDFLMLNKGMISIEKFLKDRADS